MRLLVVHEIFGSQRLAIGQLDVDAVVILDEARHLTSANDGDLQLVDPARQNALNMVLPQREPVMVASRKVADVQRDQRESRDLRHLSLGEEPLGDPTLVQDLDRA
jgi:hypothetical protein